MSERANAFVDLADASVFSVKPKAEKRVAEETISELAHQHKFPSRQARKEKTVPSRPRRVYRTGRNRHFAIKATNETVERFYKMADARNVTLGALLELALDALDPAEKRKSV